MTNIDQIDKENDRWIDRFLIWEKMGIWKTRFGST